MCQKKIKEHNPNWLQILNHPYRILITGGSGSKKTNVLLNLINYKLYTDKGSAKDLYEAKYQYLINKREGAGLKDCNDPEAFIKYSNDMDDI